MILNATMETTSRGTLNSLPIPDINAIAHSNHLLDLILKEIRSGDGFLSFARFMELALYAPGLGYYNQGSQKFGRQGDFITAPELSSLFSRCMAKQCQHILQTFEGEGVILEVGAGSGRMAADILLELQKQNCLPKHYFILELSASLKHQQHETLINTCPQLMDRIHWLDNLSGFECRGVILGNEVLDAMPVHRFQITERGTQELGVTENEGKLISHLGSILHLPIESQKDLLSFPKEYTSEINLMLAPWIKTLSNLLIEGAIVFIDYGFPGKEYYHPDRTSGTLMCHYQHRSHHDPFFYPGLQDITAHVDFTAIANAAIENGLDVLGFTNQAAFLINCGLIEIFQSQGSLNDKDRFQQNHAIQTLTSPAEMGELFKVIALGKHFDLSLIGFQSLDKRYQL